MIIIHVYCSYKSSPIGFAYGSYEYSPAKEASFYCLNNEHNNSFVLSSFEDGKIRRACGKLPKSERYIFLIRKIKHDYGPKHEDFGRDVDMNLAFEFDTFSKFCAFATGFAQAEQQDAKQLYKSLADCIFPDASIEIYKLSIHKSVFDLWFGQMLKTEPDEDFHQFKSNFKNKIKITASSSKTDYSQDILDIYQLPVTDSSGNPIRVKHMEGADYLYPVKKNEKPSKTAAKSTIQQPKKKGIVWMILLVVILASWILFSVIKIYNGESSDSREATDLSMQSIEVNLDSTLFP